MKFFLGDEVVEFGFEFGEDLIVRVGTEFQCSFFEVDEVRSAPEAEVGVVGFAGAVDPAAHDGDGEGVFLRILCHFLNVLCEFDEGFVLDSGTTRATDDVEGVEAEIDEAANASGGDVVKDLAARFDLLGFAGIRDGEGDAEGVPDAFADELLEGDAGLDDSVGRETGFGDAEVKGDVGSLFGEASIDFDDFFGVGVLEGDDVAGESEGVEEFAVFPGAFEHGGDGVVVVEFFELGGIDGAAVDTDADGAVVVSAEVGDVLDLVLPGARAFVVVEVSGIVADLVDVGGDLLDEAVVFLEVDGEVGGGLFADFGESGGVLGAIDGDANDICSGAFEVMDLAYRGCHILGVGSSHGLNGDGMILADVDASDANGPSGVSGKVQRVSPGRMTEVGCGAGISVSAASGRIEIISGLTRCWNLRTRGKPQ